MNIRPLIDQMFIDISNLNSIKGEMMKDTQILYANEQIIWVLNQITGFRPQTKLKLIYRGSTHGWMIKDFHDRCDNQGATLLLMKCKTGRICGGFTGVSWLSPPYSGYYKYDPSAFLFSVDNRLKFPTKDPN